MALLCALPKTVLWRSGCHISGSAGKGVKGLVCGSATNTTKLVVSGAGEEELDASSFKNQWCAEQPDGRQLSSGGAEVEEGERVVPKKGSSRGGAAEAADAQDGRKGGAMEVDADDRYQGRLRENCCWLISRTGPEQTGNVVSQEFLGGSPPLALVRI
eukprot:1140545-Pelagomonas_calceolata.AAC.2